MVGRGTSGHIMRMNIFACLQGESFSSDDCYGTLALGTGRLSRPREWWETCFFFFFFYGGRDKGCSVVKQKRGILFWPSHLSWVETSAGMHEWLTQGQTPGLCNDRRTGVGVKLLEK